MVDGGKAVGYQTPHNVFAQGVLTAGLNKSGLAGGCPIAETLMDYYRRPLGCQTVENKPSLLKALLRRQRSQNGAVISHDGSPW